MGGWTFRVKSSGGNHVLKDLDGDSSVVELMAVLYSLTNIPPEEQHVKFGFPPKVLPLDEGKTLSGVGLRSGETLIIEKAAPGTRPSAPAPSPAVVQQQPSPTPASTNQNTTTKEQTSGIIDATAKKQETSVGAAAAGNGSQKKAAGDNGGAKEHKHTTYKTVDHGHLERVDTGRVDGVIVRRVVPADNSCLFNSLSLTLLQDKTGGAAMRQLIANIIRENPGKYDAMLDKEPAEYCKWILDSSHWGGAIDIHILSEHFATEIDVFDTQTLRIDPFGSDAGHKQRVLLIYDGIHYDPLVLSPYEGAPPEVDMTVFDTSDDAILAVALKVSKEAHQKRQFTDLAGFSLRCLVCSTPLIGQKEAQEHAKATGHINFGEFS